MRFGTLTNQPEILLDDHRDQGIATPTGLTLTKPTISALALSASACGGGADSTSSPVNSSPPSSPTAKATEVQASRFLAQASLGSTRRDIARVREVGYAGWVDEQLAMPVISSRWEWLKSKGYDAAANKFNIAGFDNVAWRWLISSPDSLRQRVTFALSEIVVIGVDGLENAGGWKAFGGAAWLDMLDANAFGNLRNLLQQVSTSLQMGSFLTFRGNAKASATTGAVPDENYARELLQLFMIGLVELNLDGTPRLVNGQPIETYTQTDISGLARVFTGWDIDYAGANNDIPDHHRRPMLQVPSRYETGAKTFLGLTIPAGTEATKSLTMALDHLYAHTNVPPFWSRQLIQRLVTSNPSPAYVERVARVFQKDGTGQRGNLSAVVRAILLDVEARTDSPSDQPMAGKVREPILRLLAWARAWGVRSASDNWAMGNTSDPATRLGQSPLRSPSVFNFFRPAYVPPNSAFSSSGLVAPELQLTNESTVAGYLNFMQTLVAGSISDIVPDYSTLLTLADSPAALVTEINTVMAAGQLSAATQTLIVSAINAMSRANDAAMRQRVNAAMLLVLATPEFVVLK
jgi:uncharacterized protein (DUF1800 family)